MDALRSDQFSDNRALERKSLPTFQAFQHLRAFNSTGRLLLYLLLYYFIFILFMWRDYQTKGIFSSEILLVIAWA